VRDKVTSADSRGRDVFYSQSLEQSVSTGGERMETDPEGWHDDLGRSPADMLLAYARDRYEFDVWFYLTDADDLARSRLDFSAELLARYPDRISDDEREEEIAVRWRRLYSEYATSGMPYDPLTVSWPSRFDPDAWTDLRTDRKRPDHVVVSVRANAESDMPETLRFDARKVTRRWRIDRVITFMGDSRSGVRGCL
jgi:hypothetical protein